MVERSRWRRRALAAAAVLFLSAAAGCSVPSSGEPVVVGPAPAGTSVNDRNPDTTIPNPDAYQSNPTRMVEEYLASAVVAAATSVDPAGPALAQGAFLSAKVTKPPTGANAPTTITIYAPWHGASVVDIPPPAGATDPEATWLGLDVVQVGVFEPATGIFNPVNGGRKSLTFEVGTVGSGEKEPGPGGAAVRIKSISTGGANLVALDTDMRTYFPPHYIYWWNKPQHDAVVPDLRYLPHRSPVLYATQIVNLVLSGEPAPWIAPAVESHIVAGAILQDALVGVSTNPDSYSVNLAPAAGGNKLLPKLAAQLRMSIGDDGRQNPGDPPALDVLVAGQSPVSDTGTLFRTVVPNFAQARTSAQAYMIDGGKVRPANFDVDGVLALVGDKDLSPTLQNPANANAVLAGVGRDPHNVAIVREVDGKQSLTVIRDRTAKTVTIKDATTFVRPTWLSPSTKALLVGANGRLYVVDAANKPHVVSGASGVTAFSVAPDGQRVAYVSGGRLYLAVLTSTGSPTLTPGQQVNMSAWLETVTAVSWGTSIYGLLVAGGSTVVVADIYGTSAVSEATAKVGTSVTQLASFAPDPFLPTVALQAGPMMEAGGRVYTTPPPDPNGSHPEPLKTQQKANVIAPFFSD